MSITFKRGTVRWYKPSYKSGVVKFLMVTSSQEDFISTSFPLEMKESKRFVWFFDCCLFLFLLNHALTWIQTDIWDNLVFFLNLTSWDICVRKQCFENIHSKINLTIKSLLVNTQSNKESCLSVQSFRDVVKSNVKQPTLIENLLKQYCNFHQISLVVLTSGKWKFVFKIVEQNLLESNTRRKVFFKMLMCHNFKRPIV